MFKVRKHCERKLCDTYVIEWPDVADSDGIPTLGLFWESAGAISLGFPKLEQAERLCAYLNKAMHMTPDMESN